MSNTRLSGKCAIVTGGGSGIGRSVCQVFAREGANVAVLDMNADGMGETLKSLPSNHGNKHCSIQADVRSSDQVKRAVKEAEQKLGQKCTILINCAGIYATFPVLETTEKLFYEILDVNLKGVLLITKEFLLSLTEGGKGVPGSIVNISSWAAQSSKPGHSVYSASKAAITSLTKSTAVEYGKQGVRCNAVSPGVIRTPLVKNVGPEIMKQFEESTPLGRIGNPEDVANACLFLASDESSFITGACLDITGGLHL